MADIAERSQRLVADFLARKSANEGIGLGDPAAIGAAFFELTARMMAEPAKLIQAQMALWNDYLTLWQRTAERMMGKPAEPVIEAAPDDRRFRDREWSDNAVFDYIKQSYLLAARYIQGAVKETGGLDEQTGRKVDFYTRQFVDAMAPSNYVLTNPEVLRATVESRGENLISGLKNLLDDLERGKGRLAISMTDMAAFKLGENVATTPGKVVYQNDLIQLHPVRADDRDGKAAAAADHPAVDQQVLHPRPAPAELVHPLGGGPGAHGVRDLLGQSRSNA